MEIERAIRLKLESVALLESLLNRTSPKREYYGEGYQLRAASLVSTAAKRVRRRTDNCVSALLNRDVNSQANLSDG